MLPAYNQYNKRFKKTVKDAVDFLSEIKKLDQIEILGNFFPYGTSFNSLRENNAFSEAVNNALEFQKKDQKIDEMQRNDLDVKILSVDYGLFNTNFAGTVLLGNYLISKEPFDKNLKSQICEIGEKYGFSVGVYTLNDYFKSVRENNMEQSSLKLFSIIFLSIIAVFGLSSIIVYSINTGRREIGIRIACGAGKKHIILIFFTETFLITSAAFLTSCIIVNSESLLDVLRAGRLRNLGIWVYIITFVISLITCIASCVFPIRRILKLEPRELTGGND